jgi:hypothetical protein
MTELSKVKPDRDDLVSQLGTALAGKDAWKDRVTSSTGQTLIDFTAAIGAYSQYSVESAYQEVWPESAKNADSQYAAANFAGVRFNRKLPARVQVSMAAPSIVPMTIPAYSQFVINGSYWFNRAAMALTSVATTFNLYQGKIVETTVTGLGTDHQAFVTPEKDFAVSNIDVLVDVNGGAIQTITRGLWTLPNIAGCQHFTLPNGACVVLFGNDNFGAKPGINDSVRLRYALTFGADGNNLTVLGQDCTLLSDPTVKGSAISAAISGVNETDPFQYKNLTPALFGSHDAAVTPAQYKALPLLFPGVLDAQVYAQREINPKALTWMNNMKVVLLTAVPFTSVDWASFSDFMRTRTMFKCQFVRQDPVAVFLDVDVDIYCSNFSNLTDIRTKAIAAIQALFTPRRGILGFDTYRSDLERVIDGADKNIEYMVLRSPSTDIVLSSLNVGAPTLTQQAGGSLVAGAYDYGISVLSIYGGETAPANWSTLTTNISGGQVKVDWAAVANAAGYKVWGRQSGAYGLLATLPASTLTFTDTGAVTPGVTPPVQSTIASYYPKLGTLNVNCYYSQRTIRIDESK